jgi:hypothetical protein
VVIMVRAPVRKLTENDWWECRLSLRERTALRGAKGDN